jgi:hypothetical protein
MDSIFEEDADEVGGEIEAYCPSPRCKADTTHTIISMYEDEVRRVQCVVCGEVHAFRKPRGDGPEGEGDSVGKKPSQKKMSWDEAMSRASDTDLANCRPYSIRDTYEDGDVVHHPVFDIGFVVEQLPDNKVEVIFRDGGARILVHNRGDLAARMPEIAEVPMPREHKKKKRAKKPDAPSTPIPQRSKAEVEAAVVRARAAAQARMEESSKSVEERTKKMKADVKAQKPAAGGKAAKGGKPAAPAAPVKAAAAKAAKTAAPAKAAKAAKQPAKAAKAAAKGAKKPAPAKKAAPKKKPAGKPAKKAPAKKPAPAKKKKKK